MKNFNKKNNNVTTEDGFLSAEDMNSIMSELNNAVSTYVELNEDKNNQLSKIIDMSSKSLTYTDIGTENTIKLYRPNTPDSNETLFNGATVFFKPKYINTATTTIKVNSLPMKTAMYKGEELKVGFLNIKMLYTAVYNAKDDVYDIYPVGLDLDKIDDMNTAINNKINIASIVDTLDVDDSNKVLSAKQGMILLTKINNISNVLGGTDDNGLDSITEMVTYLNNNKDNIAKIPGMNTNIIDLTKSMDDINNNLKQDVATIKDTVASLTTNVDDNAKAISDLSALHTKDTDELATRINDAVSSINTIIDSLATMGDSLDTLANTQVKTNKDVKSLADSLNALTKTVTDDVVFRTNIQHIDGGVL